jgi:hypothetical protein
LTRLERCCACLHVLAGFFIQCAPTQVASGSTVNCTGGFGDASNGGLFSNDTSCCWRVQYANSTFANTWQCSAVRTTPYPFVSSYTYTPAGGGNRTENVRLQCCTGRNGASATCGGTTIGTGAVQITTNIAGGGPAPAPTGRRRALAAARLLQGLQ